MTAVPFVSLARARDVLRSAFWFIPSVCVVASIGLAIGLIELDQRVVSERIAFLFPGPPSGARSLLSAVVQAMIAFTGLVFSITIVVLQLSSGQFSPRVLRTFLRDRTIQWALGIFIATFVYAIIVLRAVEAVGAPPGFVPQVAITGAFALVLLSVALFIRYIDHVTDLIRVATIIELIRVEAVQVLDRRCPQKPDIPAAVDLPPAVRTLGSRQTGVVVSINETTLVELARRSGCVLAVVPRVGDFVPLGAPLITVHGGPRHGEDGDEPGRSALLASIALDTERTTEQDLAFSFRQLVDIAERALSPGINDPTTAAQVVDALHDLLRRLVTRELPPGHFPDADGQLRLLVPQYDAADLLDLAIAEIWQYGRETVQIPPRLRAMLADLESVAHPANRAALRSWTEQLRG